MKRQHRMIAGILAILLGVSGCKGQVAENIPTLIEPESLNFAYRPVAREEIKDPEIMTATVSPVSYANFFSTNTVISELTVEVGDYVEAGEIIAYADNTETEKELKELQRSLEHENTIYQLNQKLSQVDMEELKEQMDEIQNLPEEGKNQLKVMEENSRYDDLLHEYRIKKLNEQIQQKKALMQDATLRASHSGQVTYVKNLAYSRSAGVSETIVVISDLSDLYLETEQQLDLYEYEEYEKKYIKMGEKEIPVEEVSYTIDERILAKANSKYPNLAFFCKETVNLTLGETYLIYFEEKEAAPVLAVGRDSLYRAGSEYFVYVKNESNEREKRAVTLGESNGDYYQITEGLKEGELVYYETKVGIPADYDTYAVNYTEFNMSNNTRTYAPASASTFPYLSEYEGKVVKMEVSQGQEVTEGDLLCVISTGEGKAALTEINNRIGRTINAYKESLKSYNEQIAAGGDKWTIKRLELQKQILVESHNYSMEEMEREKKLLEKNNDGKGNMSVYATQSGTVAKVSLYTGDEVEVGDELLSVTSGESENLMVQVGYMQEVTSYADDIADIGEKISMTIENKTYEGVCVGFSISESNRGKNYLSSNEEGAYLSSCGTSGYTQSTFFVKMEDEIFLREDRPKGMFTYSYMDLKQVLVIPWSYIQSEQDVAGDSSDISYYVWKVVDGQIQKQYIKLAQAITNAEKMQVVLQGIEAGDMLAMAR